MTTDAPEADRIDTSDMLAVHAALRTALGGASGLVLSTGAGDVERAGVIAAYLRNVLAFLRVHHEGEDALVYPLLAQRCPESSELCATMTGEHETVSAACERAERALAAWAGTADPGAGELCAEALDELYAPLEPHLSDEEDQVLPLVSESLSLEEWRGLAPHAMQHFGGDNLFLILGLIREQMSEEARAQMLTMMPPPAVEAWQNVGQSAFEHTIAEVRGTTAG